ncbi:MAG: hypothetical protein NWQ54_07485 [Paraglaciecola sp.]|uniref:hypothetical protein n=1 Tax=Pseudomonadati TaxID=3379134 RepID=UPI00273DA0C9|nr:hypothetical protein [Paraglaciecola sp.]MDP5030068.1 hypothetical protein [Paraglaciecola sp.]MDP5130710.1 hypothetical protein [Paraglaciecola sp.]
MKKLVFMVFALSAFAANAGMKGSEGYKFAGEIAYADFCKAVVTDDLNLLKRTIRSKVGEIAHSSNHVLRKLMSEDGMKCNNTDLLEFSKQREAKDVQAFLSRAL